MTLLLDLNLSPRLLQELSALYTGSTHVRDVGLALFVSERGNLGLNPINVFGVV